MDLIAIGIDRVSPVNVEKEFHTRTEVFGQICRNWVWNNIYRVSRCSLLLSNLPTGHIGEGSGPNEASENSGQ